MPKNSAVNETEKFLKSLPDEYRNLPKPKLKKILGKAETYLHKSIIKEQNTRRTV